MSNSNVEDIVPIIQPPTAEVYSRFTKRFTKLALKRPDLIRITLSNVFTMRLIGNKTHGDLAEIAIAEFINQYMDDYRSIHVGKDLYRAKSREEDISIVELSSKKEFPLSLKAYGHGPLQLSTDKTSGMFRKLESLKTPLTKPKEVQSIIQSREFSGFHAINVMPLIYDEKQQLCNIMTFDYRRATEAVRSIVLATEGSGRKHPVYRFLDSKDNFIFEVRYGDAKANALQRGLWTHTRNAGNYFDSLTGGWISYKHNLTLVNLLSKALISQEPGHRLALKPVEANIERLRKGRYEDPAV